MRVPKVRWRVVALATLLLVEVVFAGPLLQHPPRRRASRVARQAPPRFMQLQDLQNWQDLQARQQQQQQLEEKMFQEQQHQLDEQVFGAEIPERGIRDKRFTRRLLNLLFWKINTLLALKARILFNLSAQRVVSASIAGSGVAAQLSGGPSSTSTGAKGAAAEDDVPDFDSNRVMLDIPGELFGTAFSVVTDVSKIVGDVILNTARRTERFLKDVKEAIGRGISSKIATITSASSGGSFRASSGASGSSSGSSSGGGTSTTPAPYEPEPFEDEEDFESSTQNV